MGSTVSKARVASSKSKTDIPPFPRGVELKTKLALYQFGNVAGSILSDGRSFITQFSSNKVWVYNCDGSLQSEIKLNRPFGISPIGDNYIAITQPYDKQISLYDLQQNQVCKTIPTAEGMWSIACRSRDIISCVNYGIMKIDIDSLRKENIFNDYAMTDMQHDCLSRARVAANRDRICYTNPETHTVIVLDSEYYTVIFKMEDQTLCVYPTGIAIDEHMNIYVIGEHSKNLVVVSPDFKVIRIILNHDDLLDTCYNISYDHTSKGLLVVSDGFSGLSHAVVWKIKF